MKIAITGAGGFVGSHLTKFFKMRYATIIPLHRDLFKEGAGDKLASALIGCDVVINLAGATLNHRWTEKYKQEIYDSRIETTRALVDAINSLPNKPSLLISTSAVGYYDSTREYTESNAVAGCDFLSKVCIYWEEQARRVSPEVRCVITRFGVVLSKDGGAYPKMVQTTKMGFMTKIGSGEQYMSWIALDDLMNAMDFIISRTDISGAVNLCSPKFVTNSEFARTAAEIYRSKLIFKVPSCLINTIMGESSTLLTTSLRVYPEKLLKYEFKFKYPSIDIFMRDNVNL